ncbi:MAG: hypothetical protein AAGJ37_02560 [Pseudomonadota bacterium]
MQKWIYDTVKWNAFTFELESIDVPQLNFMSRLCQYEHDQKAIPATWLGLKPLDRKFMNLEKISKEILEVERLYLKSEGHDFCKLDDSKLPIKLTFDGNDRDILIMALFDLSRAFEGCFMDESSWFQYFNFGLRHKNEYLEKESQTRTYNQGARGGKASGQVRNSAMKTRRKMLLQHILGRVDFDINDDYDVRSVREWWDARFLDEDGNPKGDDTWRRDMKAIRPMLDKQ